MLPSPGVWPERVALGDGGASGSAVTVLFQEPRPSPSRRLPGAQRDHLSQPQRLAIAVCRSHQIPRLMIFGQLVRQKGAAACHLIHGRQRRGSDRKTLGRAWRGVVVGSPPVFVCCPERVPGLVTRVTRRCRTPSASMFPSPCCTPSSRAPAHIASLRTMDLAPASCSAGSAGCFHADRVRAHRPLSSS